MFSPEALSSSPGATVSGPLPDDLSTPTRSPHRDHSQISISFPFLGPVLSTHDRLRLPAGHQRYKGPWLKIESAAMSLSPRNLRHNI